MNENLRDFIIITFFLILIVIIAFSVSNIKNTEADNEDIIELFETDETVEEKINEIKGATIIKEGNITEELKEYEEKLIKVAKELDEIIKEKGLYEYYTEIEDMDVNLIKRMENDNYKLYPDYEELLEYSNYIDETYKKRLEILRDETQYNGVIENEIVIDINDFAQRIVNMEKYLAKVSDNKIEEIQQKYVKAYLDPLIKKDYNERYKKSYENIMDSFPNMEIAKKIKKYYK